MSSFNDFEMTKDAVRIQLLSKTIQRIQNLVNGGLYDLTDSPKSFVDNVKEILECHEVSYTDEYIFYRASQMKI